MIAEFHHQDGRKVVSVTQVLAYTGRSRPAVFAPPRPEARDRRVKALCSAFDAGTIGAVPRGLHGFLDAYAAAVAQMRVVYAASDTVCINATRGVAERLTRITSALWGRPEAAILELTTSDPEPWHGVWLAGANRVRPTGARYGVYLRDSGRFSVVDYTAPTDDRVFLDDLAVTHRYLATIGDDEWLIPTSSQPAR
jgi:hypothetical protein